MKRSIYGIGLLLCSLFMIFGVNEANAMPALEEKQELVQPSGEAFQASLSGSEKLNWWTTGDEAVIKMGADHYWYYAQIVGQSLQVTNAKYGIDDKPSDAAELEEVRYLQPKEGMKQKEIPNPEEQVDLLSAGEQENTLVLLVEYTDAKITYSDAEWRNRFFGMEGSTLNHYYEEVSKGKLGFKGATEASGSNDGIVKVTLPKAHPRPETANNSDSTYSQIVKEALKASNAKVNYAQFDQNKDGSLSSEELHIVTIVAGGEASYGDTGKVVWGHMSSLYESEAPLLDGVKIGSYQTGGSYTMFGEKHGGHMATVGIIAHEMGHDLGLPDLYDTDGSSQGVGIHSLMASGSWTTHNGEDQGTYPTHLDPWSKMVLGFVRPIDVQNNGSYEVTSFKAEQPSVLKLKTTDSSEYFLIENRQFTGFDIGLADEVAAPGVAIWHIDEQQFKNRQNNNNEAHKAVDIEEANESRLGYPELDQQQVFRLYYDHYFSGNGYDRFNSSTAPTSKVYSGASSGVSVTVLDPSSDAMTVSVKVPQGEDQQPPLWSKNAELTATMIKNDRLTLNWSEAIDDSGIASYVVYKNGSVLKEVDGSTRKLTVQGLATDKAYDFKVEAVDKKGYATSNGPKLNVSTSANTVERIEGLNRFETAANVSDRTYNEAETVVIARGLDFPDALSGAPLAYQLKAPILLAKTNELPTETKKEIARLKAKKAIILGGENAISPTTEMAIKALGLEVERISGENRYETSVKIAKRMGGDPKKAIIAYGLNFPDALAIAPYAAQQGYPILLVNKDSIPAETKNALKNIEETIVIGGESVITQKVYSNLSSPNRIAGDNRFETAAKVKTTFYPDAKTAYLATGFGFADALAGSVLAAKEGAPLLLVKSGELPPETVEAIKNVTDFNLLGGPSAINEKVEQRLYQE
jgi:M6 family metalloprotease-like protein